MAAAASTSAKRIASLIVPKVSVPVSQDCPKVCGESATPDGVKKLRVGDGGHLFYHAALAHVIASLAQAARVRQD